MRNKSISASAILALLCVTGSAAAHVSISSGPVAAEVSTKVVFSVGHGCEGADTASVRIEIPAGVTSVRPMTSDFGQLAVETNDDGTVAAVSWTKVESSLFEADVAFYELTVRLKAPDAPFTTLYFPAHQTCFDADGEELVVDWIAKEETEGVEPAPALQVLPPHFPGWNKFEVAADIPDLSVFFSDALIVWKDDAAYSINPTTVEQIGDTEGVALLESLSAGDEIWVRY